MRQKVSCILCHRGIQLRLAYSWARPAILAAGKDSGGMFLLCPCHFQWGMGGWGGRAYNFTAVHMYLRPVGT